MAWLAVLLIVFTHATSDAINITLDFVATTEPTKPTQCCIDGGDNLRARNLFGGCDPGSHKIHFSPAFGCNPGKWSNATTKAAHDLDLYMGALEKDKDKDLLTLVEWFAQNHHTYVHKGADVELEDMVAIIKNKELGAKGLGATSSSTRRSCCVDVNDKLSAPTLSLGGFGRAYCGPGSHKIRFSSAFGTNCSNDAWNAAIEKNNVGINQAAGYLDKSLRIFVHWYFLQNHYTYVDQGADIVLAKIMRQLKYVHYRRKQESALRKAKRTCGVTFEFDADSQPRFDKDSPELPTQLAEASLTEASLMKLPGCELAEACTPAFRADIDDMVNGVDTSATPMWKVACESLAYRHTKCFEQVIKTLKENHVKADKEKPGTEWWFGEAYPLGHLEGGNKQAREMLEKIGTLKARAAAFADKTRATTTEDGGCDAKEVPIYKAYKYQNLHNLPGDVGRALTGVDVGENDHEKRLSEWMYDKRY